jgi:hypothetical protein
MSNIGGGNLSVKTHSGIYASGSVAPPPLTGALSTQFNAQFGGPPTPGLGMLNLILFG